jgi:hypothetical protein
MTSGIFLMWWNDVAEVLPTVINEDDVDPEFYPHGIPIDPYLIALSSQLPAVSEWS